MIPPPKLVAQKWTEIPRCVAEWFAAALAIFGLSLTESVTMGLHPA